MLPLERDDAVHGRMAVAARGVRLDGEPHGLPRPPEPGDGPRRIGVGGVGREEAGPALEGPPDPAETVGGHDR